MTDEDKIKGILHTFRTYGIGDIKHNRRKPIAAFILTICFIDQLASFRYPKKETDLSIRVEKFISTYIKPYADLGIYAIFRNAIIHHYSGVKRYRLTNDKTHPPFAKDKNVTTINTTALITETIKGFKELEKEILTEGSEARKNTLARARKHLPLMHKIV